MMLQKRMALNKFLHNSGRTFKRKLWIILYYFICSMNCIFQKVKTIFQLFLLHFLVSKIELYYERHKKVCLNSCLEAKLKLLLYPQFRVAKIFWRLLKIACMINFSDSILVPYLFANSEGFNYVPGKPWSDHLLLKYWCSFL